MNHHPFRMMMIAIYGGFNALLLIVSGLLLTFSRQMAAPSAWRIACGLVLLSLGALIGAAIYGLWGHRVWGRKLLCWGLLFCIPLNVIAIFPILQNHLMTMGNTLLQIACVAASIATIFHLSRKPVMESPFDEPRREEASIVQDAPIGDEDRAFTFDRQGHADRLQDS